MCAFVCGHDGFVGGAPAGSRSNHVRFAPLLLGLVYGTDKKTTQAAKNRSSRLAW